MNFRSIVNHIESLPPLCDTTLLVKELYKQGVEDIDISVLVDIIESDVILTANILKMTNSPLYGFSKQISSVTQAVTLLGTHVIYGIVLRFSIENRIIANLRPYGIPNGEFNDMCHIQSALIHQWYSKISPKSALLLTPLALIMESGKLVVSQEIANHSKIKEFLTGFKNTESISEYENSVFETSSYYVSGLLFEHWNFDRVYVDMLKGLDFEDKASSKLSYHIDALDVVRTAVNVKEILTKKSIDNAVEIVEEMELDVDDFLSVVKDIKNSYLKSSI